MQLTQHADYALRTLIALGVARPRKLTVAEISEAYGISRNHLVKVVVRLAERGYLETLRGKGGGIRLAREPAQICIGDVVRQMEPELGVVECLRENGAQCAIVPACRLKGLLVQATASFLGVLDAYTLEDLLQQQRVPLGRLLGIPVGVTNA